jgi:hypothetical protein
MTQAVQTGAVVRMAFVSGVSEGIAPGARTSLARASEDALREAALAQAVAEYPLSNAELLASLKRFKPPQNWYDEDLEGLY